MNPLDETIRGDTGWTQLEVNWNRCANAWGMRDRRLTEWERRFICDTLKRCDKNTGRLPPLSAKQVAAIERIAEKVEDVLGI